VKATLRPYQNLIRDHILAVPRCNIFASMGMGKTLSTLDALDSLSLVGEMHRALIVAPLRVCNMVWPAEVRKWEHLSGCRISVITGTEQQRLDAMNRNADIHVVNYENLPWLRKVLGKKWRWDVVVCDESTKLQGMRLRGGTSRAKALRGVIPHVRRWINLTGTPAPNGYHQLWGQVLPLDSGVRLGRTYEAFSTRFFEKDYSGFGLRLREGADTVIQELIRDISLTVRAEDWFDFEPVMKNRVKVQLPPKARKVYDQLEKDMYAKLEGDDGELEVFNAAALTGKCHQVSNGSAYLDDYRNWVDLHSAKLDALQEVIAEAAGMPVLVAYWFKTDLMKLQDRFPKGKVLDHSPATEADWNAGKIPLMFIHPQSAGHGLNLQGGGNILAFYSLTWNLELYEQCIERIGPVRQLQAGHPRQVYVHHIIAEDTIDELIWRRLHEKKEVQDLLMEACAAQRASV